jgi:hypothetical protein
VKQTQKNPEYRRAITAIVDLVKKYAHKAEEAVGEVKEQTEVSDEDEKVQQAGRDLKSFVEKLSGKSLDDLTNAVQTVSSIRRENVLRRPQLTLRPPRMSRTTRSSASTSASLVTISTGSSSTPGTL